MLGIILSVFTVHLMQTFNFHPMIQHTVDGSKIRLTTWDAENLANDGTNYQPQLMQDFFHQRYVFVV